MAIEHEDVTSIHRIAHVSSIDPGAVGAYKGWIDTTTTPHILKVRNAGNSAWVQVGEVNTASNVGASGEGVFKQKVGENLEFKKIKPHTNARIAVTSDASTVILDVVPGNIDVSLTTGSVPYTRINNVFGQALLGRYSALTGAVESITVGEGLELTTAGVLRTSNLASATDSSTTFNNNATTAAVLEASLFEDGVYAIHAYLPITSVTVGPKIGLNHSFSGGGSATFQQAHAFIYTNTGGLVAVKDISNTLATTDITELDAATGVIIIDGTLDYNNSGGTDIFQIVMAQHTANASNTILSPGAYVTLTKAVV